MPVTKKSQILVVRGQVIFPFVPFSLDVGRPRSRKIIKALKTLKTKRLVLVTQKFTGEQNPEFNDIYHVGTLCEIDEIVDVPGVDSKTVDYRIKGRGLQRVLIEKFSDADINEVSYQLLNSTVKDEANVDRFLQRIFPEKEEIEQLMEGAEKFLELENISKTVNVPKGLKQLDIITFKLANLVPNTESIKQAILEENEIANRLEKIIQAGIEDLQKIQDYGRSKNKETEFDKLDSKITRKINEQLSRQQRDFYLREKLRIIREEIGISSKKEDEVASIRKKLDENPYPEAIKKRILSELEHYENSSSSSQESTLTKTYIDTLLNLP